MTAPPSKATSSARAWPWLRAASVVRTLVLVAALHPGKPAGDEQKPPKTKAAPCAPTAPCRASSGHDEDDREQDHVLAAQERHRAALDQPSDFLHPRRCHRGLALQAEVAVAWRRQGRFRQRPASTERDHTGSRSASWCIRSQRLKSIHGAFDPVSHPAFYCLGHLTGRIPRRPVASSGVCVPRTQSARSSYSRRLGADPDPEPRIVLSAGARPRCS